MIRALLVDDEEHAREGLRALLRGESNWCVAGECGSADSLREALTSSVPDVVFLDVRLPGADGIALARLLRALKPQPPVVFITAFEKYAVDAFEVQAVDYLLKPFDDQRFYTALRRVEHALAAVPQREPAKSYAQRLVIRSIGRVQFVSVAQIDWLEAAGNYVEIHAATETYLHRERLRVLETQLDPADFVRIHRSIIVNRAAVKEIRPLMGADCTIILHGGERLRLSRTYRSALESLERG